MEKSDVKKIVGIKKTVSKKTGKEYFNLYLTCAFTDYEIENADLQGVCCEVVGCSDDYGLHIGDEIEVNYGKAFGDYQPVKNIVVVTPSTPFSKKEKE